MQTFFEIVLIFDFIRDEVENFRITVLRAKAQQKNYCRFKTDRQTNSLIPFRGVLDFFFKLNLLPPYSIASLAGGLLTAEQTGHIIRDLEGANLQKKISLSAKFMDGIVERRGKSGPW